MKRILFATAACIVVTLCFCLSAQEPTDSTKPGSDNPQSQSSLETRRSLEKQYRDLTTDTEIRAVEKNPDAVAGVLMKTKTLSIRFSGHQITMPVEEPVPPGFVQTVASVAKSLPKMVLSEGKTALLMSVESKSAAAVVADVTQALFPKGETKSRTGGLLTLVRMGDGLPADPLSIDDASVEAALRRVRTMAIPAGDQFLITFFIDHTVNSDPHRQLARRIVKLVRDDPSLQLLDGRTDLFFWQVGAKLPDVVDTLVLGLAEAEDPPANTTSPQTDTKSPPVLAVTNDADATARAVSLKEAQQRFDELVNEGPVPANDKSRAMIEQELNRTHSLKIRFSGHQVIIPISHDVPVSKPASTLMACFKSQPETTLGTGQYSVIVSPQPATAHKLVKLLVKALYGERERKFAIPKKEALLNSQNPGLKETEAKPDVVENVLGKVKFITLMMGQENILVTLSAKSSKARLANSIVELVKSEPTGVLLDDAETLTIIPPAGDVERLVDVVVGALAASVPDLLDDAAKPSTPEAVETKPKPGVQNPGNPNGTLGDYKSPLPSDAIPSKDYSATAQIIIAVAENGDRAWGYSKSLGKWTTLKFDKPVAVNMPIVRDDLGFIPSYGTVEGIPDGRYFWAYSGVTGTWDALKLSATSKAWPIDGNGSIIVRDGPQMHIFLNTTGKWSAPPKPDDGAAPAVAAKQTATDPSPAVDDIPAMKIFHLQNMSADVAVALMRQLFRDTHVRIAADARTNSLIAHGRSEDQLLVVEALLAKLDSEPAKPNPTSDAAGLQVRTAEAMAKLKSQYASLDARALAIAREVRNAAQPTPELDAKLRAAVLEAFEVRQELHRAELAEFRQRMMKVQQTIETRTKFQDEIIDRRIQDLVNPNLNWEASSPANANPESKLVPAAESAKPATGFVQLKIKGPEGAVIKKLDPARIYPLVGAAQLETADPLPCRLDLAIGKTHQLALSQTLGQRLYDYPISIEIPPPSGSVATYLQHNAIPLQFTYDDDLQHSKAGKPFIKVIYLPHPAHQELKLAEVSLLLSVPPARGANPVADTVARARKLGAVLAIIQIMPMIHPGAADQSSKELADEQARNDSLLWDRLGLRLKQVEPADFPQANRRFNGGLRVVDIRPDSPAARADIKQDDILVGLESWTTETLDNVQFAIQRNTRSDDGGKTHKAKFFVLRKDKSLYGELNYPVLTQDGMKKSAQGTPGPATYDLNFLLVPWKDFFQWLATESGHRLDYQVLPSGTFSYSTTKPLQLHEVVAVVNEALVNRGFVVSVRDGALLVSPEAVSQKGETRAPSLFEDMQAFKERVDTLGAQIKSYHQRLGTAALTGEPDTKSVRSADQARLDELLKKMDLLRTEYLAKLKSLELKHMSAQKTLELAELELQSALGANQKLAGTVTSLEISRLRLKSEREAIEVQQSKNVLDMFRKFAPPGSDPAGESVANIKLIMLALHNYHDVHGHFPPAVIMGKDGKGTVPHSWRVELLPHLDGKALYDEYHFDEPWNSDHNKTLIAKMPDVFRSPLDKPGSINAAYFALVTPGFKPKPGATGPGAAAATGTAAVSVKNRYDLGTLFSNPDGAQIRDVTDGLSNTVAIVEAKRPLVWTIPEDIPYYTDLPLPTLGEWFPEGWHAGLADGQVKFISRDNPEATVRALFTIAGNENVTPKLVGETEKKVEAKN